MNIDDLSAPPANTIKMTIPISVVLGLVKDTLPIDATVTAAHFDAATNNLELVIASDFFKPRTDGN